MRRARGLERFARNRQVAGALELHRAQVRTARKQHDVRADSREPGANVTADSPSADDDDFHDTLAYAFATMPR